MRPQFSILPHPLQVNYLANTVAIARPAAAASRVNMLFAVAGSCYRPMYPPRLECPAGMRFGRATRARVAPRSRQLLSRNNPSRRTAADSGAPAFFRKSRRELFTRRCARPTRHERPIAQLYVSKVSGDRIRARGFRPESLVTAESHAPGLRDVPARGRARIVRVFARLPGQDVSKIVGCSLCVMIFMICGLLSFFLINSM